MSILKMTDLDLKNKRVLIREDLNVPLQDGIISNDARLRAVLPTLQFALQAQARVIVISHLGRPKEGRVDPDFSLAPVADALSKLLKKTVHFIDSDYDDVNVAPGEIILLENVRFNVGEEKNDDKLAKRLAALCDIFVMDAFATAHRAQASTHGVAKFAPIACGGPLLVAELDALERALKQPRHPLLAIVGGSKVSTKLKVLSSLIEKVDQLIVGGGIANTFLAASGYAVGKSLYEKDLIPVAKELLQKAKARGAAVPLPTDVVVATEFGPHAQAITKSVSDVASNEMILDIGPQTQKSYSAYLKKAETILWNGPIGVFEYDQFAQGTETIARAIAESSAFSIAGGGDTLSAIDKYEISKNISYISTGGGAFLEFIEGAQLPAVAILEQRTQG